jgi:type IV secretion system protein TrbG
MWSISTGLNSCRERELLMTARKGFFTVFMIAGLMSTTMACAQTQIPPLENVSPKIGPPAQKAVRDSTAWVEKNQPPAKGDEGRVVFTYGATMPTIVCSPLHVCEVELEKGETVIDKPHIGDAARWKVAPAISGVGEEKTVHVIIKPTEPGLETNLVIPTDRRVYHLRLVSKKTSYVARTSFYYPESEQRSWAVERAAMERGAVISDLPRLSVEKLNFAYKCKEDKGSPKFLPVRVFDDGTRTYIQMPGSVKVNECPVIVLIGSDGTEQLVNYRFKHNFFVVDRLFEKAALISGVGWKQDRVLITRSDKRRGTDQTNSLTPFENRNEH